MIGAVFSNFGGRKKKKKEKRKRSYLKAILWSEAGDVFFSFCPVLFSPPPPLLPFLPPSIMVSLFPSLPCRTLYAGELHHRIRPVKVWN